MSKWINDSIQRALDPVATAPGTDTALEFGLDQWVTFRVRNKRLPNLTRTTVASLLFTACLHLPKTL
jgi:hypothetical protein